MDNTSLPTLLEDYNDPQTLFGRYIEPAYEDFRTFGLFNFW